MVTEGDNPGDKGISPNAVIVVECHIAHGVLAQLANSVSQSVAYTYPPQLLPA